MPAIARSRPVTLATVESQKWARRSQAPVLHLPYADVLPLADPSPCVCVARFGGRECLSVAPRPRLSAVLVFEQQLEALGLAVCAAREWIDIAFVQD
jgi:hypothetical protein